MSSALPKVFKRPNRRTLLPYLILALGLWFTFLVSFYFAKLTTAQDQSRFKSQVQEIDERINTRIQTCIALLRAGTGLFAASEDVSSSEFERFVTSIELQKNYPGIQGIGFSIRLLPDEREALIAHMKAQGVSDFKIWSNTPYEPREEYNAIIYLQPMNNRNHVAIGFDMATEAVRRQAMEAARDSGKPTASGRVVLVQEPDTQKQSGFLIYAPVYKNGADTSTPEARRNSLVGYVYSPFRVDDFIGPIYDEKFDVDFKIYDGEKISPDTLLHDSHTAIQDSIITTRTSLKFADRVWTLVYSPKSSFESSSNRAFIPYTVLAGLFLSLLFFGVTRAEVRARSRAETAAGELAESESTIRQTLTDRELAEEALREGEERYRELIENANDIVYMLDFEGRITSINKAAEMILGYSQDELLGMKIADVLATDSVDIGEQMLTSGHQRTNYEVEVVTKGGRVLTLETSNKLITRGAQAIGIQGIARDISARRRTEEALREADQRALSEYERLLERISGLAQALGTARELTVIFRALRAFTKVSVPCDGFFVSLYDPIQDVRTACYAWGDDEEFDVSALPPMPVTAAGPNSRAVRTGQVVITNDYMSSQKHGVIVGPDNGLRPQSSMAVPMTVMGRIIGTIEVQSYEANAFRHEHETAMSMAANLTAVAIENVRLLRRESSAREAAEESNRLKDEFLATVSHELRTPLTAILGWARLLDSESLDEGTSRQAIETIWRNAKSQAQIIDDILDVSRIITGNLYLDLQPLELEPVIQNAINVVRPTADAKRILIEAELDSAPAVVSGDANRLQQVIWNLLSNAVKFTNTGGRVSLKMSQVGSAIEITVTDTGDGISREFLPFVFDRFRQADSSTTRQHGGLGLGLAIARHLVEIHGGTIRAESAGQGYGSSFTIKLPLLDSQIRAATGLPAESLTTNGQHSLSGLHVLVVDDDADTLELMTTALTSRKADVTAVNSASEALDEIQRRCPDVLISDIAMPEEDGYGLIAKVRAASVAEVATIPAVAITAYAKDEDRQRALDSGFQIYLAKPVELSELISVVARAAKRDF